MGELDQAFNTMKREMFLPPSMREFAHEDRALSIGYEQTNSQPRTVRALLEWLKAGLGNRVLDVGSGSGWTTALLSHLVGEKGHVVAVELIAALVQFGKDNCREAGIKNAEFHIAGKTLGRPEGAPYDRILVSAAAEKLPMELVDQLADNGRMTIPINESVWTIEKRDGEVRTFEHYGFSFVPLVSH